MSFSILIIDPDPKFGGSVEMLAYLTREEAVTVAEREIADAAACGIPNCTYTIQEDS